MLGTITAKDDETWQTLPRTLPRLGVTAGSEELYLGPRGLRTLSVRLARHHETGLALARRLKSRPEVARALHPGLEDNPGHALWRRDFSGACGPFGVVLAGPYPRAALAALFDGLEDPADLIEDVERGLARLEAAG